MFWLLYRNVGVIHSPEFQKLWRSVPVDSIDEEKIEEYLKKQGISSMQETGPKKMVRSVSHTCRLKKNTKLATDWLVHAYLCGSKWLP